MGTSIKDLCLFLHDASCNIWDRIRFARETKHRISETTITENLLFEFWSFKSEPTPIDLWEAKDEKTNGNDLEIFIETPRGYPLIVCQAKILNKLNRYSTVFHKVGSNKQIDLLIDYAKKKEALPAYLFYNYMPGFDFYDALEEDSDKRRYGVTCFHAEKLKALIKQLKTTRKHAYTPTFDDLHPSKATPLNEFICEAIKMGFYQDNSIFNNFAEGYNFAIHYYNRSYVEDKVNWQRISSSNQPNDVQKRMPENEDRKFVTETNKEYIDNLNVFNPKYRVVFNLSRLSLYDRIEIIRAKDSIQRVKNPGIRKKYGL